MLELVKEGDEWVIKGGPPKRADMEVVVRCKDCKYYVKPSRFGYCDRHSAGVRVTQRDYCSWGERKEAK